jgi:hypothetical protein
VWRDTLGSTVDLRADASGAVIGVPDGVVDEHDYAFWKSQFGTEMESGTGSAETGVQSRSAVWNAAGELSLADDAAIPLLGPARRSSPSVVGEEARSGAAGSRALVAYFLRTGDWMSGRPVEQAVVHSQGDDPIESGVVGALDAAFAFLGRSAPPLKLAVFLPL